MSETVIVRAAADRRVVDPSGHSVPSGPFAVNPADPWWWACLRTGDVVKLTEAEIAQARAEQTPATVTKQPSAAAPEQGKTATEATEGDKK